MASRLVLIGDDTPFICQTCILSMDFSGACQLKGLSKNESDNYLTICLLLFPLWAAQFLNRLWNYISQERLTVKRMHNCIPHNEICLHAHSSRWKDGPAGGSNWRPDLLLSSAFWDFATSIKIFEGTCVVCVEFVTATIIQNGCVSIVYFSPSSV